MPVLEEDGRPLPESVVIMEFLEERYPEPALLPADPADRAAVRLLIFRDDELTDPYYAFRRGEGFEDFDTALRSSTRRSRRSRTSPARSTRSPTSPTSRGSSAPATCSTSTSSRIRRSRRGSSGSLDRPAVAAEAGIVAAL